MSIGFGSAGDRTGLHEEPLAKRSGPRGATLFVTLPAEQTGIATENTYSDPDLWEAKEKEFALGSIGSGVAIGDYDNDGKPDVFIVSKTDGCHLFRNLGNWKFEDVTSKAGLDLVAGGGEWANKVRSWLGFDNDSASGRAWKQGATFVDVNNDGLLDLYICVFGAPNLLFINQGDGTFREEAAKRGLAVADASGMAEFCDYDRDGWLDLYLHTTMLNAESAPSGQRDYLFHNNGDGTFTNVTARAGIHGEKISHSATWWDYDNDGWPDLYVANDFAVPDRLYRNNRDGTFTDVIGTVVPHIPYSSMGSDLGDINNDGLIDFFVADMAATTHEKDQRGMATSRAQTALGAGDNGPIPQYPRNALFINTGKGRMLEAAYLANLATTDWTWSVRLEDFDNDGRLDLLVTNGMVREYQNGDLRERILQATSLQESRNVFRCSPVCPERNLVFRNLGNLEFQDVSAAWGLDKKSVTFGAAVGDLDGDGDLDLVTTHYQAGASVLRNDSDEGHRVIIRLRGTRSNSFGVGAVLRVESALGVQVRQIVLARGYFSSSDVAAHFGLGTDETIQRLTITWPSGIVQTFHNLPADRRFTITEPKDGATPPPSEPAGQTGLFEDVSTKILPGDWPRNKVPDTDDRQSLVPVRFGRMGPALVAADLLGSGKEQFVVGAEAFGPLRLVNEATLSLFAAGDSRQRVLPDGPLLAFDAMGTGLNDVLVTKSGNKLAPDAQDYQPILWLNQGAGVFRPAASDALPDLRISAGAAVAADFDRDGHLDVFVGGRVVPGKYPLSPKSALWRNRGRGFEDVTDTIAPALRSVGLVTSALWTDVDGDGWVDLLVTTEWGKVRCFRNVAGKAFEEMTDTWGFGSAGNGWWTSIAAADFNGDGKIDYVVGNVGLNTQYHASAEQPAVLFYGAFCDRGSPQPIEAYFENGRLYPWRTRNDLGAKIPAVLKRFPKNDDYARATITDILGDAALRAAQRFEVTELRSGVFLSQPDGTYRFCPLPRLAQISPFQGIAAGDFDGDGASDIYAVQNTYSPAPPVARFDGGLSQFLRGDGRGHFVPVPVAESGLLVPGNAKGLVLMDLNADGWPDFVVSRNGDTPLAFQNRGTPERKMFQVKLAGKKGNPHGVGSRVEVVYSDKTVRVGEIYAGSSYFSQSSPSCFFGYNETNRPLRIRVRWPDGEITESPFKAFRPLITVTKE